MPICARRSPNSLAMMAVPSMATPLVNSTRSPFSIRRLSIRSLRETVPAIMPATMGLTTASVISVCPPHNVIPQCRQYCLSSSNTLLICDGVVPQGKKSVARNHLGIAPEVAMSLALIKTAYCPMESVANVIGSDFSTNTSSDSISTAAISSPTPGLINTLGSSKTN